MTTENAQNDGRATKNASVLPAVGPNALGFVVRILLIISEITVLIPLVTKGIKWLI